MAKYNDRGEEMENDDPVAVPLKFKRPESIHEMIARAVRTQDWNNKMSRQGRETFEEANDFDVGDDVEPDSRYEVPDDAEFDIVEQKMLDKAQKDMDNERALNDERKRRKDGTDKARTGNGDEGVERSGEERAAARGEGRAAGRSGGGVSEVRRGNRESDEARGRGDRED